MTIIRVVSLNEDSSLVEARWDGELRAVLNPAFGGHGMRAGGEQGQSQCLDFTYFPFDFFSGCIFSEVISPLGTLFSLHIFVFFTVFFFFLC